MPALAGATNAPGTAMVTTAETAAQVIGPLQLQPPPNATGVVIRGVLSIATGAAAASLTLRLRLGNGVAGAQVPGTPAYTAVCVAAAAANGVPFHFVDPNLQNISQQGYTVTATQNGATGNGAVSFASYEVDYVVP